MQSEWLHCAGAYQSKPAVYPEDYRLLVMVISGRAGIAPPRDDPQDPAESCGDAGASGIRDQVANVGRAMRDEALVEFVGGAVHRREDDRKESRPPIHAGHASAGERTEHQCGQDDVADEMSALVRDSIGDRGLGE